LSQINVRRRVVAYEQPPPFPFQEELTMNETATKVPVKAETKEAAASKTREWRPFESLRREIDRLFDETERGFWRFPLGGSVFDVEPFWRRPITLGAVPAVDITEKDKEYEITAELPGMDESNIEVTLSNGALKIKGEKREEKEETKKDYYLSERRYGSFQRCFQVPEGVDPEKIEARFKKGVLTITLPKTPEALKKEKKIAIKAS
jgi:HSP20 family protein